MVELFQGIEEWKGGLKTKKQKPIASDGIPVYVRVSVLWSVPVSRFVNVRSKAHSEKRTLEIYQVLKFQDHSCGCQLHDCMSERDALGCLQHVCFDDYK